MGFGLLRVVNCKLVNIWGKLMEDKVYFNKVCHADSKGAVPSDWVIFYFLVQGRGRRTPLQREIDVLLLGSKGEGGEFFLVCCFLCSAQNNPYGKGSMMGGIFWSSLISNFFIWNKDDVTLRTIVRIEWDGLSERILRTV